MRPLSLLFHSRAELCASSTLWLCLLIGLAACSGNRDSSLKSGQDPTTGLEAGVDTPPPEPVRRVTLGPSAGRATSTHYRAQLQLSFPSQPKLARGEGHAVRLLPGTQP